MYTANDIAGATVLNHVDRTSIGAWNEAKINNDKTLKASLSMIALAVTYFNTLATQTGTDLDGLDADDTAVLNDSLLWYIAGKIKERDIADVPKDRCSEDDYRLKANYFRFSCESLARVSMLMSNAADFCTTQEKTGFLEDLWGSSLISDCECHD